MLKYVSGAFLMIGAIVGGGMLAIPIASAACGFFITLMFIILSWALMTTTGLYVLDLSLSCPPENNSYYSIVGKYLGNKIRFITVILYLWILYFSLSSDISGSASLIMDGFSVSALKPSHAMISLISVLLFGSLIVISSKIMIRLNVILVISKLALLVIVMGLGLFYTTHTNALPHPSPHI